MKSAELKSLICVSLLLYSSLAFAYHLPKYEISAVEWRLPAEEVLSAYNAKLKDISLSGSFSKFEDHRRNSKVKLTANERAAYKECRSAETAAQFWTYAANLKKAILGLSGASKDPQASLEADSMAKTVVETLYKLSQRYKVGSSAYFHNFLINMGVKKEGFCYHYTGELKIALSGREWKFFDIHWGGAREGTRRESNAIVITAKGLPFDEGIAIDAWRKTGRPFWTNVKGDRYPWVKSDYD